MEQIVINVRVSSDNVNSNDFFMACDRQARYKHHNHDISLKLQLEILLLPIVLFPFP